MSPITTEQEHSAAAAAPGLDLRPHLGRNETPAETTQPAAGERQTVGVITVENPVFTCRDVNVYYADKHAIRGCCDLRELARRDRRERSGTLAGAERAGLDHASAFLAPVHHQAQLFTDLDSVDATVDVARWAATSASPFVEPGARASRQRTQ